MTQRLHREIKKLNCKLKDLGEYVFEGFDQAMDTLKTIDVERAQQLIQRDHEVDEKEMEVEEDCLKILALYQPVARDLRYVVSALKINNEIERIGDLSANICSRVLTIAKSDQRPEGRHLLPEMAALVREMLELSLNSFTNRDIDLARKTLTLDDAVDDFHARMHRVMKEEMIEKVDSDFFMCCMSVISISRFLERIADHSTNIAEDVIYSIEGDIVRHNREVKG